MEDNKTILDKAFTFFKTAIKKYDEGEIEGALSDVQWGMQAIEEAESEDLDLPKTEDIIGENYNFGKMYKVIEENAEKLYMTEKGRNTLRKIIKTITENKILKQQFNIYNSLTSLSHNVNVDDYLNEATHLAPKYKIQELKENNAKLAKLIEENGIAINAFISSDDNKLYESIEYILTNNKNLNNLSIFMMAEDVIKKHLSNNVILENNSKTDINEVYQNKLSEIERKYNCEFNDDEIKFLSKMTNESFDREKYFNDYKNTLSSKLNRLINESSGSDKNAWMQVSETINNMVYDNKLVIEQLAKMIEINNKIDE